MRTKLNIQTWNRESHFHFFKEFDNPFYNLCTNVNVTELKKFCKKNNISFFLASLFLSIKAANDIEEFKYRIVDDSVFIYDRIHPFSTIFNDNKTFSFCEFNFVDSFKAFVKNSKVSIDKTKTIKNLLPKKERLDVIHYTAIPWVSITSISHARNFNTGDSIPKFVLGKYFKDNAKLMLPFCVEVNHALVDGYHVGLFFSRLEELCSDCNNILI